MMTSIKQNTDFSPLLGALKQIQFRFESTQYAPVMVAMQTAEEFKQQKLPAHCTVKRRKIKGPRVPIRGVRNLQNFNTLANWPNDGLTESVSAAWYFVVSGEADIRIWDYVVHCEAGDVVIIPGHTPKIDGTRPHYESVTLDAACDILMLHVRHPQDGGISVNLCHSRGNKHSHAGEGEHCWVKHLLLPTTLFTLSETVANWGSDKSTFHLIFGLILLIQREIEQGRVFSAWSFPAESDQMLGLDPIQQAMEYMQNHVDRSLSIDTVARWVGLSRTAFIRLFREQAGKNFHVYLTQLRLERAKKYLLESILPISRISSLVGLTPGQLRNLFRQYHQCSPREFRRSYKDDRS